jgi:hypothetical protein
LKSLFLIFLVVWSVLFVVLMPDIAYTHLDVDCYLYLAFIVLWFLRLAFVGDELGASEEADNRLLVALLLDRVHKICESIS